MNYKAKEGHLLAGIHLAVRRYLIIDSVIIKGGDIASVFFLRNWPKLQMSFEYGHTV